VTELIHTCYRVTDPERSVAFYEALGFEKRRELPIRDEAVNYFLGIPGHASHEPSSPTTSKRRTTATSSAPAMGTSP
jgi:catechol 2,3-dioxygenase-like lactoylglutathione lyase family enzyme